MNRLPFDAAQFVRRYGHITAVVLTTLAVVVVSISITAILLIVLERGMVPGLYIAFAVPVFVAPIFVHLGLRAASEIARSERVLDGREAQLSQEVAELKSVQAALAESEERFRRLFEDAAIGMTVTELEGTFRLVNRAFCDMLGYSAEELYGLTASSITHPEDREQSISSKINTHHTGMASPAEEKRYIGKNGEVVWGLLSRAAVKDENGQSLYTIGQVQDITAQKRIESALRDSEATAAAFLDATLDTAILAERDGTLVAVNDAASRRLGHPREYLVGRNIFEFFGKDSGDRRRELFNAVFETGVPSRTIDESNGQWLDGNVYPVFDNNGTVVRVAVFNRDVTEQKRAEEALRQSQKMEAVGQLTGGLAHDFNNLLAAILGNLEIISRHPDASPFLQERVAHGIRAAQRGATLTNRLLAFARQQTLEPQPTNLNSLVIGLTDLLQRSLGETIRLELSLEPKLWPTRIDHNQLENALLNLALNARDAMPSGGSLKIQCMNYVSDGRDESGSDEIDAGEYVLLSVIDTGGGMAPDVRDHAFEPFFTTKDRGDGSGLGLSMVFGFVNQSGGHVDIRSVIGSGTEIGMYFPRDTGVAARAIVEPPSTEIEPPTGNGERILLVEDDVDVRESTTIMLEILGYEVVDGGDGSNALTVLAAEDQIKLLLSDIVLPGQLNGPDIAAQATSQHPELRVLLMTGYADAELPGASGLAPRFRRLKKPFNLNQLASHLAETLEQSFPS